MNTRKTPPTPMATSVAASGASGGTGLRVEQKRRHWRRHSAARLHPLLFPLLLATTTGDLAASTTVDCITSPASIEAGASESAAAGLLRRRQANRRALTGSHQDAEHDSDLDNIFEQQAGALVISGRVYQTGENKMEDGSTGDDGWEGVVVIGQGAGVIDEVVAVTDQADEGDDRSNPRTRDGDRDRDSEEGPTRRSDGGVRPSGLLQARIKECGKGSCCKSLALENNSTNATDAGGGALTPDQVNQVCCESLTKRRLRYRWDARKSTCRKQKCADKSCCRRRAEANGKDEYQKCCNKKVRDRKWLIPQGGTVIDGHCACNKKRCCKKIKKAENRINCCNNDLDDRFEWRDGDCQRVATTDTGGGTAQPITYSPTATPTASPAPSISSPPSDEPTISSSPTSSREPSGAPSDVPSGAPSASPSDGPSSLPSPSPQVVTANNQEGTSTTPSPTVSSAPSGAPITTVG